MFNIDPYKVIARLIILASCVFVGAVVVAVFYSIPQ